MRSQFPRHVAGDAYDIPARIVSISDEKPVPSPRIIACPTCSEQAVSISDEKPVPSPQHLGTKYGILSLGFNLR